MNQSSSNSFYSNSATLRPNFSLLNGLLATKEGLTLYAVFDVNINKIKQNSNKIIISRTTPTKINIYLVRFYEVLKCYNPPAPN